jgi:hypothetical protein
MIEDEEYFPRYLSNNKETYKAWKEYQSRFCDLLNEKNKLNNNKEKIKMDKLICQNAKNYKLTEGNEYEIIKYEGENLFLVNDNGKTVRYARNLFEEDEELVEEVVPVAARTEQDLIDSITCNGNVVKYVNFNKEQISINNVLEIHRTNNEFSCGINLVTNINAQILNILNIIENDEATMGQDLNDLLKALIEIFFKNFIKHKIENGNRSGIFLMSTNTTRNGSLNEEIFDILDEISDFTSNDELNENSGNNIKLWGFCKSNL